jgi:N-acetyl-gamma-glutamyl-phosphate reductase
MIKAGIMGGAGFTGGELIRILLGHPQVQISFVQSRSQQGRNIHEVHPDLLGETDLNFSAEIDTDVQVVFLCTEHGQSARILEESGFPDRIKIIDLSQDFRLGGKSQYPFIYGLPELNREKIRKAAYIANPGCFATAIQLALLPLASHGLLRSEVHVSALTGSTGAGVLADTTTHFSWRSSNISIYKPFRHQHLAEIYKTLREVQPSWDRPIRFLPFRGNFTRGIFAALYLQIEKELPEFSKIYSRYYKTHPFVLLSETNPALKQVINTNKCMLYLEKQEDQLLIISIIDNLIKGAAGQAVQNMNLMFGLEETCGLHFKPQAF